MIEGKNAFISIKCPPLSGVWQGWERHIPLVQVGCGGPCTVFIWSTPMIPWWTHCKRLLRTEPQDGVWYIRRSLELCIGLNDRRQRNISCIQNIQRETCHILTPKDHLRMLLTVVWIADKGRTGTPWWSSLSTLKQTRVIPVQSTCYQHKSIDHQSTNSGSTKKNDLA